MGTQQNLQNNSHVKKYGHNTKLDKNERDEMIQQVEKLCASIDPFQGLDQAEKEQLEAWGIEWENPYDLTNKLVKWLEDMIEQQQAEQKSQKLRQ